MAFDVLQRWKEGSHIDTSPYRITPFRRIPIPRFSPWPAIAAGLDKILPQLDPQEIARRRLVQQQIALAQQRMPLEQAKTQMALNNLPIEQQAANLRSAQLKRQTDFMSGKTPLPEGYDIDPMTGLPKKVPFGEQQKKAQLDDLTHTTNVLLDGVRAYSSGQHPDHQNEDKAVAPLTGLGVNQSDAAKFTFPVVDPDVGVTVDQPTQ